MHNIDFTQPMRQSKKGIIVIFLVQLYKVIKSAFIPLIVVIISALRKNSLSSKGFLFLALGVVFVVVFFLVLAILKYRNFIFHITDSEFRLDSGIINKENTVIPKSKIQNISIKQNVIQQLINVVSLNIETAGDDKSEIEINALDKATALDLKQQLFSSKKEETNDVQDDINEATNVYFKASPKRLFLEGITQNHLRSFGIMVAFVFGIYTQIRDFIKELNLSEKYPEYMNVDETVLTSVIFTNLIAVVIVVLLSILVSMVLTFIANFNLRVVEHKNTIEINKGLFQKISLTLAPSRIQNIIISTNRLKQYFGLNTLCIKQAMTNKKQQKNFNIVALKRCQVHYLVNKLISELSFDIERYKPRLYYIRILTLKALFILSILNILVYLALNHSGLYLNILFLPFAILYVVITYRKAYYFINENQVCVGSGFIDTLTNFMEIHKVQAVKIRQSFFQKRRAIASVVISTASKAVTIPYIDENDAYTIHDFLLYKVESENKDWM